MNNDQNQLNQVGTITPQVPQTPQPMPGTEGAMPANTIVSGPVGPAPVPQAPAAPSAPVPPQAPLSPTVSPIQPNDGVMASPVPPAPMNLQPEGVVVPPAPENNQASGVVEPLMSTSLNNTTAFQQPPVPGAPVPPQAPQAPMPPNPNNQIGMIGGVPTPPPLPSEADAKPKKGGKKILIIILAVVLVLGVGFGVYYFLVLAKQKDAKSISPILTTLELGTPLDTSLVANYVNLKGYTSSECKVDTNLDPSTFGTYEYTVTCGKDSAHSVVEVKDTKAPVVTLREVVVVPGTAVSPEDFVASSSDASPVTYKFEAENDYSAMDVGSYDVNIIASDSYDNSETFTGKLVIDENAPEHYTSCPSTSSEGTYSVNYVFGITPDGEIYNVIKKINWTYADETEYQTAVNTYKQSNSLDGFSGAANFDDAGLAITIDVDTTVSDVATELSLDYEPSNEDDLDELFEGTCALQG